MATFNIHQIIYDGAKTKEESTSALYTDYLTATGTDDGEWIDMKGVVSLIYIVNGITTGTVNFRGYNGATAPEATEHAEAAYGTATSTTLVASLTADGVIGFKEHQIFRWMKAYLSNVDDVTLDLDMKRIRYY